MGKRILYISASSPDRATYGSEIRSFHIKKALEQIGKLDVALVDPASAQIVNPADVIHVCDLQSFRNDRLLKKLRWILDPRVPYPHGFGVDTHSEAVVSRILQDYHLIWFSKLRTANLFRRWAWPRSIIDVDDVPSTFERSVLQNGGSAGTKLLSAIRLFSWRRRESLLGERFSVIAVCSEADEKYLNLLRVHAPIHVIPNGSEKPLREPVRNPADPPRIGFVGFMDYYPNIEGLQWFLGRCWPAIKRDLPNVKLRLAGKGSDGQQIPKAHDVEGLGWVSTLADEISTWSLMIVPIRLGAGTRGKIAEGFGRKCPIVSTSLGAFGYEVQNGEEVFLADSAEDFSAACIRAIRNPLESEAMAEKAYGKFLLHWTWEAISPQIWAAAENCLRRSAGVLD